MPGETGRHPARHPVWPVHSRGLRPRTQDGQKEVASPAHDTPVDGIVPTGGDPEPRCLGMPDRCPTRGSVSKKSESHLRRLGHTSASGSGPADASIRQAKPVASGSERARCIGLRPLHSPGSTRHGGGTHATDGSQAERVGTDRGLMPARHTGWDPRPPGGQTGGSTKPITRCLQFRPRGRDPAVGQLRQHAEPFQLRLVGPENPHAASCRLSGVDPPPSAQSTSLPTDTVGSVASFESQHSSGRRCSADAAFSTRPRRISSWRPRAVRPTTRPRKRSGAARIWPS
jgi:hypothetical protein